MERAHAEAFSRLTPEQRELLLRGLSAQVPPSEIPQSADPQSLARLATRAEMRQPGTIEQTFSRMPAGPGLGGIFLATLAGAFVGTAVAGAFFDNDAVATHSATADEAGSGAGQGSGAEADYGDVGGDFGGGDFGGF